MNGIAYLICLILSDLDLLMLKMLPCQPLVLQKLAGTSLRKASSVFQTAHLVYHVLLMNLTKDDGHLDTFLVWEMEMGSMLMLYSL